MSTLDHVTVRRTFQYVTRLLKQQARGVRNGSDRPTVRLLLENIMRTGVANAVWDAWSLVDIPTGWRLSVTVGDFVQSVDIQAPEQT